MHDDAEHDKDRSDPKDRHRFWQSPLLAILILFAGFSLSFYLAATTAAQSRERIQDRFQATVQQTTRVIQEKIDRFSLLMMAGRGVILNNQTLPSTEINERWHGMFDSFSLDYANLGVVGLSFTRFIDAHQRDAFITGFNEQGDRTLRIFPPPNENQPSLTVLHLVPKSIESRMLGYDLMGEDKRRQAVIEAMRTGKMVVSRPLTLLPTDVNSLDYLQMLPVRTSAAGKPDRFLGLVTIGFSMSKLMDASLADLATPMRIQLFDTRESLDKAVYDSHAELNGNDIPLSLVRIINIGKHSLTLKAASLDSNINRQYNQRFDTEVLITGLSITLMLTLISMFFIITRHQALQLSQKMSTRAEEMFQRYRSLFLQSPEAIVVHVDGRVELANRHAARIFGCDTPEALYNRPINELVDPGSMEFVERRRAALNYDAPLEPAEQRLVRTNGETFMAEVSSSLINYQGKEGVQVVFRDISAEKLQRLEGKVSKLVFEHCRDALMVTDNRGRIEMINPAFQRLTGYSAKHVLGRTPDLLNAGHHSSDFFYQLWSSAMSSGLWRGDIVNRNRFGRLYIQETSIYGLRNEEHQITHFVCLMRDATHERNGFEDLNDDPELVDTPALPNRLQFQASSEQLLREAREHSEPLSLGIVKLHPAQAASGLGIVLECIRPLARQARVARLNDGELAFVLNPTLAEMAPPILHGFISEQLGHLAAQNAEAPTGLCPEFCIGTATYPDDAHDIDTLMLIAKNRCDQNRCNRS